MPDYQAQFECLENQVEGCPDGISWLLLLGDNEIATEIKMLKPANISAGIGLARMQEEKLQSLYRIEQPPPQMPPLSQRGSTVQRVHHLFDDSIGQFIPIIQLVSYLRTLAKLPTDRYLDTLAAVAV